MQGLHWLSGVVAFGGGLLLVGFKEGQKENHELFVGFP